MFRTFTRTWWRENHSGEWPDNLEPHAGRRSYKENFETEEEARAFCKEWNATHPPGRLSRKCEYTEE